MAVVLEKGGRINLEKGFFNKKPLTGVVIGLGWNTNRYVGSKNFDLDLVIVPCRSDGMCVNDKYLIFYNNLQDPEKAIKHSGDNQVGGNDGDDESAFIDFSRISDRVQTIKIYVTIFEAKRNHQNFGLVDNAYIRIIDKEEFDNARDKANVKPFAKYNLKEQFSSETSVLFGEIYRKGQNWFFKAVGEGYPTELEDICIEHGLRV